MGSTLLTMNRLGLLFLTFGLWACSGEEVNQIQNVGNLEKIKALGSFGLIFDRIKNPGEKIDKICGDSISSKTCQNFKKKGKCGSKKVAKKCKLTCEKCEKDPDECPKFCLGIWDPICGSDGKTYSNEGCLEAAKCSDPGLHVVSNGECGKECPKPCIEIWDPVCGSDGKTYSNEACLEASKCMDPNLHVVSTGECGSNPGNKTDIFGMIDKNGDGFITINEWVKKAQKSVENYGVNLSEKDLKEIFSTMACTPDGKIGSKKFLALINDDMASPQCTNERAGPFWKWVKIAIKVVVVIIEICCLTGTCNC